MNLQYTLGQKGRQEPDLAATVKQVFPEAEAGDYGRVALGNISFQWLTQNAGYWRSGSVVGLELRIFDPTDYHAVIRKVLVAKDGTLDEAKIRAKAVELEELHRAGQEYQARKRVAEQERYQAREDLQTRHAAELSAAGARLESLGGGRYSLQFSGGLTEAQVEKVLKALAEEAL